MTELIVKLLGAVILLSASLYYGQTKISSERDKLCLVSSLGDMVRFIGERIEHFSEPLPEILAAYRNEYLGQIGYLDEIRSHGIKSASLISEKSSPSGELEVFEEFAAKIGKGYREEEIALCRYTYERLSEHEKKLEGALKDKEKLYRTIPPMLALSVILILM